MVTAKAAMAVVRAARPVFRCAHDGMAFAANAAFLADGYSLCAVGPTALIDPWPAESIIPKTMFLLDIREKTRRKWELMVGTVWKTAISFCTPRRRRQEEIILMKCMVIADFLSIDALDLVAPRKEPCNIQINVKDFFSEEQHKNYKDMYKNFTWFINILNTTLLVELARKDAVAAHIPDVENSSSINSSGNVTWENPSTMTTEPDGSGYVLWESPSIRMIEPVGSENVLWENPGTRLIYPPVVLVGHDDTFPVPGVGFYPHSDGTGGSMHVGPNDPCFFPTNPSTPFGDHGSVPPGGRYDPIGLPDVPGFEPSRFVRHSRHSSGITHPDLEFFQQGSDFF